MSPLLRSRATALAVSRPTLLYPVTLRSSAAARLFSQTAAVNAGGAHGDHYDPPTGWLWGEEPTPGKKKEREDWELIWYFGMFGSLGLATIAYAFKPDTRYVGFMTVGLGDVAVS